MEGGIGGVKKGGVNICGLETLGLGCADDE